MHLFYTPDISGNLHTLEVEESRHAAGVLRLRCGDIVHLTDGRGTLYRSQIIDPSPKACSVEVLEIIENYGLRPYRLHVAVAPTKNIDRYEWFLEKATEMGIDRITPILTSHSERKVVKHDRSLKVVLSAVKQSLKAYVPRLDELTPFKELIQELIGTDCAKYIAYCDRDIERINLASHVEPQGDYVVLIGPEGDFSPEEVSLAMETGFKPVSLGESRLRTETAALFAVAAIMAKNQN